MAEPRARLRGKGQVFSTADLSDLLYAYGDKSPHHTHSHLASGPLPTTISTLDEILTDFIIETCHSAALCASYSRRQKIKVDDFKWVLRKDERLLGRVLEQLWRDKRMREERKLMDFEKIGAAEGVGELEAIAQEGGAGREDVGGKKGRGRKRRVEDEGEGGGREPKRIAP